MKEIPLFGGKGVAIVDDVDYPYVVAHTWGLRPRKGVATNIPVGDSGKRTGIYLHRVVAERMGLKGIIGFGNGNKLDCRRANLKKYRRRALRQDVIEIDDQTVGVRLANDRGLAIVSIEDREAVAQYSWCLKRGGYAQAYVPDPTPGSREWATISLHHFIAKRMGILGKVDHENRNGLDCRRRNLRPCSSQQNAANRGPNAASLLGVKGVRKLYNKYAARIKVDGKQIHLGMFDTVQEASDAYFAAAQQHFGEFACRE